MVDSRNSDASERIPLEAGNINELSLERDLVYSQALSDTNIYRAEIPSPNGPLAVPHLLISSTREDSSAQVLSKREGDCVQIIAVGCR